MWRKSIELVKEVYKIAALLPKIEAYNLADQMRRCAVSIPSNIAEGYQRKSLGEYIKFLNIADASAAELETQLIITSQLYQDINIKEAESLLKEVQKMMVTMIKKLNGKR